MPRRKKPNVVIRHISHITLKKELWRSSQIFVSALRDRLSPPTGPQKSIYLRITTSGKRRRREATQCPPFFPSFFCAGRLSIFAKRRVVDNGSGRRRNIFFFFGDIDGLWTGRWIFFSQYILNGPPTSFPTKMHTFSPAKNLTKFLWRDDLRQNIKCINFLAITRPFNTLTPTLIIFLLLLEIDWASPHFPENDQTV